MMYVRIYPVYATVEVQWLFTPLSQCSLQGAIQLSCMREIADVADVEQQLLCQAAPFECSTAQAVAYCDAQTAVTEQPSTIPGVSQVD